MSTTGVGASQGAGGVDPTTYTTTPEDKKKYEDLMKDIRALLAKTPITDTDTEQVKKDLDALEQMKQQGKLDSVLLPTFNLFLLFLKTGAGYPDKPLTADSLTAVVSIEIDQKDIAPDLGEGKITLNKILGVAIGDADLGFIGLLLKLATEGYGKYNEALKQLQDQLKVAKAALDALADIKAVLAKIDSTPVPLPQNPKSVDDIKDQKVLDLLDKLFPELKGKSPDEKFAWIKAHPGPYITGCNKYFEDPLAFTVTAGPEDLIKLFKAQDTIAKQIEVLKAQGGDTSSLQKVLDDLRANLPQFNKPDSMTWEEALGKTTDPATGKITYTNFTVQCQNGLQKYITEGNKANSDISNDIDNAVTANQTLSDKASDELKVKNTYNSSLLDMLMKLLSMWNQTNLAVTRASTR